MFANMKFKWEGQPIPLTTPMLAIAAAGNDAAGGDDAANEDNAAANEAAGSAAEAHLVPHSPPVSPVREPTPERQPVSERPPSPSPTIPETEWVVPNPVSPVTDWRPWPYVPVHSPIRDPTPEPESPPTPPAQTFIFEEPLVFGPEPRPAGYVDPDVIEPIIFGPQPRPHGYVDPDFVEPIIFGPQPRPDNYLEPEDLDNIISMEDDTTHGGFHVESPVRPDDAPTPTADAAGRAEDPALLTGLSAKLDRCMGRIDSLETELGKSKKIMGGAILTLVSRVKKLEKTVKQLRETRLVVEASAAEGDVDIQDDIDLDGLSRMASTALGHDQPAGPSEDVEEREEEEVPLRRKRSAYRRARTEFSTPAFEQFHINLSAGVLPHTAVTEPAGPSVAADKGKAPMPDLDIPAEFLAEDAQARKRFEEEQASERLAQRLRAEDLAQADLPNVSEERAKELDDLMMRMTETDWLNLMMQVGSDPALARELLGADVNEENFIERMNAVKERKKRALADLRYRALKGKPLKKSEVTQMMRNLVKNQWCAAHNGTITMKDVKAMHQQQLIEEYEYICRRLEKDRLLSAQYNLFRPKPAITEPPSKRQRVEPFLILLVQLLQWLVSLVILAGGAFGAQLLTYCHTTTAMESAGLRRQIGVSPFADYVADPFSFPLNPLRYDDEIVDPRVKVETIPDSAASPPRSRRKHRGVRSDDFLWDKPVEDFFSSESVANIVDVGFRNSGGIVNMLCQSLLYDDVEDFWRTQDEWIMSSWQLYPKSSVHVLDLTNGKTVYMFVDKFYPIRATLLERMLRHRLTVPPSYCRDVVVAGNIIQTVQAGLRQAYECIASVPIACTARQMVFSSPWLTAKKESGSPLQTALVCNSNPLIAVIDSPFYSVYRKSRASHEHMATDWKLLVLLDVLNFICFCDSSSSVVSFDAACFGCCCAAVSAACIVAAGYIVSAGICDAAEMFVSAGSSSCVSADYVPAGHVLISADRYRIC
ncbi:hypothetical protein Tco_0944879 [Tanacetum coccineum]